LPFSIISLDWVTRKNEKIDRLGWCCLKKGLF
jgi:hypothetical protein